MLNDTAFHYSEQKRKELLEDGTRIHKSQQWKNENKKEKKAEKPVYGYFVDIIKTGLAAIFHR